MKKKNIAIIAGGFSGEAAVSRKGASVVEKHIDRSLYNVYKIYIYKNKWYYKPANVSGIPVDRNDFSIAINGKKVKFDCVFNVIHGTPGEDGKLQGYFDTLSISYTNSNQTASSITFNKYLTGIFASHFGVNVPKSVIIRSNDVTIKNAYKILADTIGQELGFPCIAKPNKGGSSIGLSKVTKKAEIKEAIQKALYADDEVLFEQFIPGTEITCGMIRKNNKIIALPLTEVIANAGIFDYEAKYEKGKSQEITPARVSKPVEDECKRMSALLFEKLNCKGMVRMDYIVNKQKLFLLDINTVPGLSEASIVPKQAACAGITLKELYNIVINEALQL